MAEEEAFLVIFTFTYVGSWPLTFSFAPDYPGYHTRHGMSVGPIVLSSFLELVTLQLCQKVRTALAMGDRKRERYKSL